LLLQLRGGDNFLAQQTKSVECYAMQIRCPHCHHPVEVIDEKLLEEVTCPTCRDTVLDRIAALKIPRRGQLDLSDDEKLPSV
jgi:hypothetical protein